ncbi:MAG: S46 family peptidase [Candidatus Cryptobacteroides sp.]|jgi:hypothetical protein
MKKIFCTIAAAVLLIPGARADEGMWLLPLLQEINADAMKDLGCRLTPDQIYSINHSSLKDAVVVFGGGCTGELISNQGLLVTNHHCGYSSIQGLSTDEHNYLEDGYWAMSREQELPVEGLSVTFLKSMTDVTDILDAARREALEQYADSANVSKLAEKAVEAAADRLKKTAEQENPHATVTVRSFYNNNVYYLIVNKVYRDVRFVGAPPASIGKFGGETDNWMWPRHTGDFSMFRVYAGKDNEPARYSKDNVPYVPARSLTISLKGINEGDFAMILGYPGRTQRFQTEAQLQQMMDLHDISIAARTIRQDIMWKHMESDPSVRLKYASKYAGSSNGRKKWIGQKKAFKDLRVLERERQKEADFYQWVLKNKERKEKYGTALQEIADGVAANRDGEKAVQLFGETVFNIELLDVAGAFAGAFRQALTAVPGDSAEALQDAYQTCLAFYDDYYEPLDREVSAALLKHYRDQAQPENALDLGGDFATMDLDACVNKLFDESRFTSPEKLKAALPEGFARLRQDPVIKLYNTVYETLMKLSAETSAGNEKIAKGSKSFAAGLMEWKKKEPSYPDANSTMRLTYGSVKSYSPQDALTYRYYSTIYGVIEKEDPDNYEFRVPKKLKDLYVARDYGPYAMADGNLPVCFLTNNDITGGNSGSPVLNADGHLIGLAFDGNWESMSGDVIFEPELQRCICVDIRYVLFLMDKFGGAGYLLKEMNIVK